MTDKLQDLIRLLENFDPGQVEVLSGIALRLAEVKTVKWTGRINFEINASQGGLGDMCVSRGEIVKLQKKRRIRSSGLR